MPNECWQSDCTHYRLADGADTEIITWLDDHSRYALHVSAHPRITAATVLATFTQTAAEHGYPASTLTDNGMVYTVRLATGRGGRTALEAELAGRNIRQKNSRPNHPTTCGKVERFQQTLKKWLRAQPDQPTIIHELQALLAAFVDIGLVHPPAQARLADPEILGDLRDRLLPTASQIHSSAPELQRLGSGHPELPSKTIIASDQVSGKPGQAPPPPPHRHRPNPRPNPRPAPHPGPARPRHPRRNRATPPRPQHRPHPRLPTHRQTPRPGTHKQQRPQTPIGVQGHSDVLRHHRAEARGFEPRMGDKPKPH
jgi:integrase-like protein